MYIVLVVNSYRLPRWIQLATANGLSWLQRQSPLLFVVSNRRVNHQTDIKLLESDVAAQKAGAYEDFPGQWEVRRITSRGAVDGGSMESTWWWQRSLLRLASFQTESSQSAADRGARVVSYVVVFREHISSPWYCDRTFENVNSELSSVSFWERNKKEIHLCICMFCKIAL